ncbi:MAG: hypothetical protein Q8O42_18775 [Acidobacteriota bacterium]|nr:hypothetical protein [Acidobacteriota bacterium]
MPRSDIVGLESVEAKLRRAHHHLSDLTTSLTELGRNHKPELILKSDRQSVWLVVYFKEPFVDLSCSTILGDFLHNLRSCLDALVHALIQKDGGTPKWNSSFPIFAKSATFERNTKRGAKGDVLAGVPDDLRRAIKELQPFMRPASSVELDPLHILNVMCNQDKHEAPHIMVGFSRDVRFALHRSSGSIVQFASHEPLVGHGPWQVPVPMPVSQIESNHRIEAAGGSDFLVRTDAPWQGRPVLDLAHTLVDYVESKVLPRFRPRFQ